MADIAVQLGGWPLNLVLGIVVTFALVRMLGARRFGEWSTIFAIAEIATTFVTLGMEQVAIRQTAVEPRRQSEWISALVTLRAALAVPVTLVALAVMLLTVHGGEAQITAVVIACTLLATGPGALRTVFQARVRNDVTIAVTTLSSVLWTAAVLAIAGLSGGLVPLAVSFLVITVITTAVQAAAALRHFKLRLRGVTRSWGMLARLGALTGIGGLLTIAYGRIDQVIVFQIAGAHAAGLYAAPYRILDRAQFVPISVMTTLFPILAASYPADPERVRRLLQRAGEYLAMALLPALALTIVASGPIVRLLFGSGYAASAPALPVLIAALVVISFGYLVGSMVVVVEMQRRAIRYAAIALVVNVALNLALVPRYGFLAAAWVTLVTEILVNVLIGRAVLGVLQMRPNLNRIGRALLAAGICAGAVAAVKALGAPLSVLVAVTALSYGLALRLLGAIDLAEVVGLLRREPA